MRRLPSRRREDFNKYLEILRLKTDNNISDFTLLGYSAAKLPGDDFSICPSFENQDNCFEFLMDIAGFRYLNIDMDKISIGATNSFQKDLTNQLDPNAIKIFTDNIHIGFVPRILLSTFHQWLADGRIEHAVIERKNGQTDRPVLYAFIKISKK